MEQVKSNKIAFPARTVATAALVCALSVVLPQLVASFKMGEVVNAAADKSIIFAICAVCLLVSGILWAFVKNDK